MDKVLKQRLVGASILIALAVIFLPMLFHGGAEEGVQERELALDLPERDAGDRRVRRLALNPDETRRPAEASQPDPSAKAGTKANKPRERRRARMREQEQIARADSGDTAAPTKSSSDDALDNEPAESVGADETSGESDGSQLTQPPESEDEGAADDQPRDPAPADPPTGEEAAPADTAPAATDPISAASEAGGWVVQVAVFSNRETAGQIRKRLDELGHSASMDVLVRDQAELFRLRTGPYAGEAKAAEARSQIAATVAGVNPAVLELSGQGKSEDRSGLAVQVGSFASRNNAERLSTRLSEAGFDAFMFSEESGGRTIWRVRVGTHDERAEAEALLETLREEQGLDGIVVSHP